MSTYVSHPLLYPDTVEDRLYQTSISEAARERNTLVILPTALGKTVISALVAAHLLLNYRTSRILVMAPTRPLVLQHKGSFRTVLRLPEEEFKLLTGKTPADYRQNTWSGSSKFIFATPQVVRNDLMGKRMDLSSFSLLVFDECHRAVKEYAYTEIAKTYFSQSSYPLILGMTASPGSDYERVKSVCSNLYIEHVEYRGDDDPDVKPYIHPIEVEWRTVELPLSYTPLRDILKGMLDDKIRWLTSRGLLKRSPLYVTKTDIIRLGAELRYRVEMSIEEERGPIYTAIVVQATALTLTHMLELLETQGAFTLQAFMNRIEADEKKSHMRLVNEQPYSSLKQLMERFEEHPKVKLLREIVEAQLKTNPDSRILIFTQYRDTVAHLVDLLSQVEGVRIERFVGQASKLHDEGLTQEEQADRIEALRKGHLNILCATSIAEEGLDIPEVDLVVFYEPVPSEIRYIQRRGRTGRKTAGRVTILATRDSYDYHFLLASQRRVEKMKKIASTLSQRLKPLLRPGSRPPPDPMTPDEIATLRSKTLSKPLPIPLKEEPEPVKLHERQVAYVQRRAYMMILEDGLRGVDYEALYREFEAEGFSRGIVAAAIRRLVKKNYLKQVEKEKTAIETKQIPGARVAEITVEKIMPGYAVVLIDGRWRARLLPTDYNGPQRLIRKNSSFKASITLYTADVLHANVRQVIQSLD